MTDTDTINSKQYWESRFATDWESNYGREQSRFFAQLAVEHLPVWFRRVVATEKMSICDWGCAEGDGTDVLASFFGRGKLTGIDFSETAIENSRLYYPDLDLRTENWLDTQENFQQYDVVFSSNTLEHFHRPYEVLKDIAQRAKKLIVLVLPYREFKRIDEHHYTFLAENIPLIIDTSLTLIHADVIDCSTLSPNYWGGQQIVLIYGRANWLQASELSLADLKLRYIPQEYETQITELNRDLAERDTQITSLNQVIESLKQTVSHNEMYLQQAIYGSLSWRLTAPLRWLADLGRLWSQRTIYWGTRFQQRAARHGYLRSIPLAIYSGINLISRWVQEKSCKKQFDARLMELQNIILDHKGFIDLFHVPMGWNTPLFQRFQHMSLQAVKLGGLALYGGHVQVDKDIFVYQRSDSGVIVFDALNSRVVDCIFSALRQSDVHKIIRIQSIDLVTTIEDINTFLKNDLRILYEYIDELSEEITGLVPSFVFERHRWLLSNPNVFVIATSDKLYNEVLKYRQTGCLLSTNGVDLNHWRQRKQLCPQEMQVIVNKGRVIVGYHGALAKWLDYDLIRKIADDNSFEVVLIGYPHDKSFADSGLANHPKVHFLGSKSYFELPNYATFYNIGILPFIPSLLTDSVSPVKIFEYMAAGKPVVTTNLPECKKYPSCLIAEDSKAFIDKLHLAISIANNDDYLKLLNADAEANSWKAKALKTFELAGLSFDINTSKTEK